MKLAWSESLQVQCTKITTRPETKVGVYFLVRGNEVVYIGQSNDVDGRVEYHRTIVDRPFDHAFWLPLAYEDLLAYEGTLIRRFRPRWNLTSPRPRGDDAEILERLGLPPHNKTTLRKLAARRLSRTQRKPKVRVS